MNHKRKRPKNRRGGCLLCKPWKVNGYRTERADGERFSNHRRRATAISESHVLEHRGHAFSRDERDREILDARADYLNAEMADVLAYQATM